MTPTLFIFAVMVVMSSWLHPSLAQAQAPTATDDSPTAFNEGTTSILDLAANDVDNGGR